MNEWMKERESDSMWQEVVVLKIFAQAITHQQYKAGQKGSLWFIF